MHAKNTGDRRGSSDDCQIALVEIVKRANLRLPFQASSNCLRRVGSALHGHLRDSRQGLPLFLFGIRQIANNEDVRIIRNREVSTEVGDPIDGQVSVVCSGVSRRELELGGVDGDAARLEKLERADDELETRFGAAEVLAKDGIEAEVIDLRTLRPLDVPTVIESVKKTNRVVTVEESWPVCSIGSEICARVACEAFDWLDAPPTKVSGADVPMPYAANLEKLALPSIEQVVAAVKGIV